LPDRDYASNEPQRFIDDAQFEGQAVKALPVVIAGGSPGIVQRLVVDVSDSGDTTLVSATPGKKVYVLALVLSPSNNLSANTIQIQSNTTAITGPLRFPANPHPFAMPNPGAAGHLVETAPGEALVFNQTAANETGTLLIYYVAD